MTITCTSYNNPNNTLYAFTFTLHNTYTRNAYSTIMHIRKILDNLLHKIIHVHACTFSLNILIKDWHMCTFIRINIGTIDIKMASHKGNG